MTEPQLSTEDIEYVADMLRAFAWIKDDLGPVSSEALRELEESLGSAESALRRIAAEMQMHKSAGLHSN